MVNLYRGICTYCRKVFAKESVDQKFCSYLCGQHSEGKTACLVKKEKLINCIVCRCKQAMYDGKHCSYGCSIEGKVDKTFLKEKKKIKKSNESWVLSKGKKKSSIPSHILAGKIDRKRVFDEKALNHFYKRREWDFV